MNTPHSIIPPHIAEKIIENGSPQQTENAKRNLTVSKDFRAQRQSIAKVATKPGVTSGQKNRQIYDAKNGSTLPGTLVRSEGEPPTGDAAADEAYDGAGATYDL